jgi:hypothetical protein
VDGDRGFLNGRSNRSSHPGVLRLDDTASPSEIPVIPVQGWIPFGSGSGCVPCPLVGLPHRLTPHSPHSVLHSPDETNPRIDGPADPSVPRTRIWGDDG